MSTVRPNAKLTIDNPDADGLLSKHGFGYDWRFQFDAQANPSAAPHFRAGWLLDNCEIIPSIQALGLRGYAVKADMSLDDWTVLYGQGYWREETPKGRPAVRWLAYTDARANQYGSVMSNGIFEPRVAVWLIRFLPPPDQADPVFVEITLHGETVSYVLQVPLHDQTYKYPRLHRDLGEGPELVDEWQVAAGRGIVLSNDVVVQAWWIEETDGLLIISAEGADEPWVYEPENDDLRPQAGHVTVTFRGHCGLFNLQPISYPASGTAKPARYMPVPDWMNASDANYLAVVSPRGEGTVSVADDSRGDYLHRPAVTLTASHPHRRPIVYAVHQYHRPTFSAPRSSPEGTAGRAELLHLTWTRRWPRGWEFRAVLRDPEGHWADRAKLNCKCTVEAGWDGDYQPIMVGYLQRPGQTRGADSQKRLELEGRDYVLARLVDKKYCAWPCSPDGWVLAEWVRWMLNRAGVPDDLLDITDDGYIVPRQRRKQTQFEFRHDTPLLRALDEVLASHNWLLWIKPDGKIAVGPEPQYSGTPDFTLDEDSMTADDVIYRIEATSEGEPRNYVAVFYGTDVVAEIWHDEASHRDPSDPDFIGDDWWRVVVEPDQPAPAQRAQALLLQSMRRRQLLRWETVGKPSLKPGDFVKVEVDGIGVPSGTIFRIIEDRATLDNERLEFRHSFVGEIVEQ